MESIEVKLAKKREEAEILRTAWLNALKTGAQYTLKDGNSQRTVSNFSADILKKQYDIVIAEIESLESIAAGRSGRAFRIGAF